MEKALRATIYMGANIKGKFRVDQASFSAFLQDEVVPRFAGFTVRKGTGYWQGVPELSYELVILGEDTAEFRAKVFEIAALYKGRFDQDAVMATFELVDVAWDVPKTCLTDHLIANANN